MKCFQLGRAFGVLALFSQSIFALGNTEAIVPSIYDGQVPYMVVVRDHMGASQREPGVYCRDKVGAWTPLATGDVLTGVQYQGILAQLSLSELDRRYEGLAVVDGKLRVLQLTQDPNETLTIGEGESALTDVFGSRVFLPSIKAIEDINIEAFPHDSNGQMVLVSVCTSDCPSGASSSRIPERTFGLGNGVTFSFVIKSKSAEGGGPLELLAGPRVLEYGFLTRDQLRALKVDGHAYRLYSRLLLQRFVPEKKARKRPRSEARPVSRWKEEIERAVKRLAGDSSASFNSNEVPVYDVEMEETILEQLPRASFQSGQIHLAQTYDPLRGQDEIFLSGKKVLNGRLDERPMVVNDYERFYIYQNEASRDQTYPCGTLVFIDSIPHAICGQDALIPLGGAMKLPVKGAVATRMVRNAEGRMDHYLFFSYETSEPAAEKGTDAYVITEYAPGIYRLVREISAVSAYMNSDELDPRLFAHGEDVLMDVDTPVQGSGEGYSQLFVKTHPLLNLTKTTSRYHPVIAYLYPVGEKFIPGNAGVYRKFEVAGSRPDQSGFVVLGKNKEDRQLFKGNLLSHQTWDEITNPEIASKEACLPDRDRARISVVPIDSGFQKGERSFKLLTILSSEAQGDPKNYFESQAFETEIPRPFKQLIDAWVLQGAQKNALSFTLVIALGDPLQPQNALPELIVRPFKLEKAELPTGSRVYSVIPASKVSLGRELVEPQVFFSRLKIENSGMIYWQATPDKPFDDPGFILRSLQTGEAVYPNQGTGKRLNFWSEAETTAHFAGTAEGTDDAAAKRRRPNKWRVFSEKDAGKVLKRDGDFAKSFAENKFPGLAAELDSLADKAIPPVRKIYIVSDDLFQKFKDSVIHLGFGKREQVDQRFHFSNYSVALHIIDPYVTAQMDIVDTLESIRILSQRPLVLGDLQSFGMTPPQPEAATDPILVKNEALENVPPHLLHLLALEGRRVSLDDPVLPPPSISMALFCPLSYWKTLKVGEGLAKILPLFQIDKRFLTGTWKVWPESEIKGKVLKSKQDVAEKIFPDLKGLLGGLADPRVQAKHKVLLVSKEIKDLIYPLITDLWQSSGRVASNLPSQVPEPWSHRNTQLELYKLGDGARSQDVIFQNMKAMKGVAENRRSVLIADLKEILRVGRPSIGHESFTISDWVEAESEGNNGALKRLRIETRGSASKAIAPHLLYLLHTEGKRLSTKEFSDLQPGFEKVSMLLVGEANEWMELQGDLELESRFGLAERFEVVELKAPSIEDRVQILKEVVGNSQSMGYTFDTTGLVSGKSSLLIDPEEKILAYLASRAETISGQTSRESAQRTTADFIKVLTNFKVALVEDPVLRRTKTLDRKFVERLLSKSFNQPLNLQILEPDDPYIILSKKDMALKLNELGYRGPLDLKMGVIDTLLKPTRNEHTLAIPGSIIVMGETSTGKTLLFMTLMKALGLKEYNYQNPKDEDAGYMVVNVGRLTSEKDSKNHGNMSVDTAIAHINNFLSLPKGYRGHILFDDLHKGDKDVIKKLLKFLQAMFEAEGGILRVERMSTDEYEGEIVEIPTRNIHPWMTLNSTLDKVKMEELSKGKNATDLDVVVATLSTSENRIESSFLMRWGQIINLSKFPLDAHAPSLAADLRKSARHDFNRQGRFVMVAPQAVRKVVNRFQSANARELLPTATGELLQRPNELGELGSVFVVVPQMTRQLNSFGFEDYRAAFGASGRDNERIANFVRTETVAVPVADKAPGRLALTSIMIDTLRTIVYESFVDGVSQSQTFAGNATQSRESRSLLAPLLHAITSNFRLKEFLSWSVVNLDPLEFVARGEQEDFKKLIEEDLASGKSPMPPFFERGIPIGIDFNAERDFLFGNSTSYFRDRRRSQVLLEYHEKVSEIVSGYLKTAIRVGEVGSLPTPEVWAKSLSETEPEAALLALANRLGDLYLDFTAAMADPSLIENREPGFYSPGTYDIARLFVVLIDRAIAKLPWGGISSFIVNNLAELTKDMELNQRKAVQYYLFTSKSSIVCPVTHEFLFQKAENISSYKAWPESQKSTLETMFQSSISRAFAQGN